MSNPDTPLYQSSFYYCAQLAHHLEQSVVKNHLHKEYAGYLLSDGIPGEIKTALQHSYADPESYRQQLTIHLHQILGKDPVQNIELRIKAAAQSIMSSRAGNNNKRRKILNEMRTAGLDLSEQDLHNLQNFVAPQQKKRNLFYYAGQAFSAAERSRAAFDASIKENSMKLLEQNMLFHRQNDVTSFDLVAFSDTVRIPSEPSENFAL